MMARRLFYASALLCLCLGPELAGAQVFHDDFDGTALDPAVWSVDLGTGGQVVVADGVVTVTCTGNVFPVVTSVRDPFPPGDFLVRVRMRYNTVVQAGDGFGALDNFWGDEGAACRPFLVWQDANVWLVEAGGPMYLLDPRPDTQYHVYEWTYVAGRYAVDLDGTTLSVNDCALRPTRLFFGHPHPIVAGPPWTSFEIDFVHVEPFGATATQQPTFGAVKARFR
jgi:hypothetical protein